MKKVRLTILTFACCCLLTSCEEEEFLDVTPRNEISSATFWRTEADVVQAATGVYSEWGSGDDQWIYYQYFADAWSDDGRNPWLWSWYYQWGQGNISPQDGTINERWVDFYRIIRQANVFLTNVDRAEMDEALRTSLKAEVRFIRAFEYFQLFYMFGEVPLVQEPLAIDELGIGRAAEGETIQFILNELDLTITDLLPLSGTEQGRINKEAAMALKARILLYQGNWDEAANVAKEIMDSGVFELFRGTGDQSYKDLFLTPNENNVEVVHDREMIKGLSPSGKRLGMSLPRWISLPIRGGTGVVTPTQALVDAYDAYDPVTDQIIPVDPDNEFENRDPRLDFTIAHTGTPNPFDSSEIFDSGEDPLRAAVSGYGVLKFVVEDLNGSNGGEYYDLNHIVIRYAEVLLTYAEAKIESGSIDQSVLDAINDIRSRAYGVGINDTDKYPEITTIDQVQLREIVRKERRVELAMEGLRWYDIKRWRIAHGPNGVMNGPVLGAKVAGTNLDLGPRTFDEGRDYLRPIPQAQIDLAEAEGVALTQNPGY